MTNQKLQEIFWRTKHILCEYDYNVKYGKFHNIAELVDKGIIPKSIL